MSFFALDRQLGSRMLEADERRIPADSEQYRQKFAELAQSGRLVAPRFGDTDSGHAPTDSRRTVTTYSDDCNSRILGGDSGAVGDGGNAATGVAGTASAIGNSIQITVATFVELAVQPHQIRISSGGGGGSDRGSWGDKDNEKDKLKPRKRRR